MAACALMTSSNLLVCTSRPGEARDKTKPNRVVGDGENNGDRRSSRFGCKRRRRADRGDHGNLSAHQISRQGRQPMV